MDQSTLHSTHQANPASKEVSKRVFVIDDDYDIRSLLKTYLEQKGFQVETSETGEAFLDAIDAGATGDLAVLDVMLPGADGFEVCRQLRRKSQMPVIMLTASSDEMDRIIGLEIGADDYLAKPFNPRELLARMRAILRRMEFAPEPERSAEDNGYFQFAGFELDTTHRILRDQQGQELPLSGADYTILKLFIDNPGEILSRETLANSTRGRENLPMDRFIDVQISRLRQRLNEDARNPQLIKTVRGKGYVLTAQVSLSGTSQSQTIAADY